MRLSRVYLLLLAFLAAPAFSQTAPKNVAILLFDDVQIIDYAGPYEVFGSRFNVFTVAPTDAPITTIYGMKVIPDYAFGAHPPADIVVLPGGGQHRAELASPWSHTLPVPDDPALFEWVKASVEQAEHVLTVCNGAFILARAGLLDDLTATTTAPLLGMLAQVAPRTTVVADRRFVDNGKIVTSAGLSAGIDAAFHVVEKVEGRGQAQRLALGLEYNWDPAGTWARAALADRYLRFNFTGIDGVSLYREGDRDRWENAWKVTDAAPAADVLARVDRTLAEDARYLPEGIRWQRATAPSSAGAAESHWRFSDAQGQDWHGLARVVPAEAPGAYLLTLRVERAGTGTR